jgi:hypothetical protein
MSHYIRCPACEDDSLDTDTLSCECGYSPGLAESQQVDFLKDAMKQMRRWIVLHRNGALSADVAFREIPQT